MLLPCQSTTAALLQYLLINQVPLGVAPAHVLDDVLGCAALRCQDCETLYSKPFSDGLTLLGCNR
jgi:hypothetical protein